MKPVSGSKNTSQKHIYVLVSGLFLLCLIMVSSRLLTFSTSSGDDTLWKLNITAIAIPANSALQLNISPPFDTDHIRIVERGIFHPGMKIKPGKKNDKRNILLSAQSKEPAKIKIDFLLQHSHSSFNLIKPQNTLTTVQREQYLGDNEHFELYSYTVQKKLKALNLKQPDPLKLSAEIFNSIRAIPSSNRNSTLNVSKILTLKKATTLDRSLAMVAICRAAGIPARLISGLIIQAANDVKPHYWVQTYENSHWNDFDIQYGYSGSVPGNFLPLRRDSHQVVQVQNGRLTSVHYSLKKADDQNMLITKTENKLTEILNLNRMPYDVRQHIGLLLILPLGALITAVFRYLIGIHSYGVFTPTLLALAVVYADVIMTAMIFIVVCSLAISGRSLFPKSIDRTVRLSIIFTLIAFILSYSVSVLSSFNLTAGDAIILLPIIILTSLVDRFYTTMEDRGLPIALNRLFWTAVVTICCVPVIQFETLGQLLVKYPELHFITLGLLLLLSTYKGHTFIKLPFLSWLAEPESSKKKTSL